jgi:glycosyltransferase involved in cell wall biosynthesis
MRRITEQDTLCKILKYNIIANPIDTELFFYNDKDIELRKKVLILRSFGSRKYANDISVKAILELQKSEYFNQFSFTIIGEGQYFDEVLKPLRNLTNVTIKKGVINQSLIPTLHANHGIFLCPTRQDSQGVSMCEAMSSGLVPITSKNTAIPEFVKNSKTGFLTNTPNQIAESLEQLLLNPNLFREVSKEAAGSIRQMCGINLIIQKEFLIIES